MARANGDSLISELTIFNNQDRSAFKTHLGQTVNKALSLLHPKKNLLPIGLIHLYKLVIEQLDKIIQQDILQDLVVRLHFNCLKLATLALFSKN